MGLAIFGISLDMPRQVPRMVEALTPLFAVESSIIATLDMPSDHLPNFLALLADPRLQILTVRQPRRSPSSSRDTPRICLDLVFPAQCAELDAIVILSRIRLSPLPPAAYFALNTIYDNREAMILEFTRPDCIPRFWPLCVQLVFLARTKALVVSHAESDTWGSAMDQVLKHDPEVSASRLRWRPSAYGGRPVASPSATTAALAATRRKA